ncbi:MAG: PAS domain S-box-containing protein [Candidatus Latescibacterota bacterium]|jgi:PAS domain S-box-containing protein
MARILVIDDARDIRETLSRAFTAQEHTVTVAIDGDDGLLAIQNTLPDLIFLDLSMPRMSGIEVLEALQNQPRFDTPIIILTAQSERECIVECLDKGAIDYIVKPFSMQELLARTNVQLRLQELEREVRDSEAYHRALFERSSDPEMVVAANGEIRQINVAAINLLAVEDLALIGQQIYGLIDDQDQSEFSVAFAGALDGSDMPIFEVHLTLPGPRLLPVDVDLASVSINNELHLLIHLRDISRRKSAEAQSSMILYHIGDAVVITDQTGLIMMASRSAGHLTGCPEGELIGIDITQFHAGEEPFPLDRLQNNDFVFESLFKKKNGTTIPIEWTLAAFEVVGETFYIGVVRDLTERHQAESQRIEADRLKTLLEIAGGTAHEINQPLTAILGYAEMTQHVVPENESPHKYQQQIINATLRINDILKTMQTIRSYQTRPYTHGHNIVDFEQSSNEEGGATTQE